METAFLEWLRRRCPPHPDAPLGFSDDAAWYCRQSPHGAPGDLIVTTDLLCDGVHFRVAEATPESIGYKALAVNLSDMAAMAVRPELAVVSLLWSRDLDINLAYALYEGLLGLADHHGVVIAGGDTNCWDGGLVINVTVAGRTGSRGPLTRSGARPGDAILVTGQLGGSLLGHHLSFQPRVEESLHLHERYLLHAGMDISDGLALDLHRMMTESGVGAELDLTTIPIAQAAHLMSQTSGRSPLQHALSDGEDFELLLVAPADEAARIIGEQSLNIPVTQIGTIITGEGLWFRDAQGDRRPLAAEGYLH